MAEAVQLLERHGDEAKPLAGGQSLVPILALRLTHFPQLVDLNRIADLRGIERRDGRIVVRAMTLQATVEESPEVAAALPILAEATTHIGHFQIRNRGTLGGSIAHADPASEYPALALALDAEMEVTSVSGTRTIPASEFFVSFWTTALEPGELLTAVSFPLWNGRSGFGFEEVARRHGDFALAGAVCGVELGGDGRVERAAIGLMGLGTTPLRAPEAEAALVGVVADGVDLAEVGRLAVRGTAPSDDIHASGRYRKTVAAKIVEQALSRALARARGEKG